MAKQSAESRFEKAVYEYDYELEMGKESIMPNHSMSSLTPNYNFFGYCYQCDYAKHSQNYCPLRLCYRCGHYGHSGKVCIEENKKTDF